MGTNVPNDFEPSRESNIGGELRLGPNANIIRYWELLIGRYVKIIEEKIVIFDRYKKMNNFLCVSCFVFWSSQMILAYLLNFYPLSLPLYTYHRMNLARSVSIYTGTLYFFSRFTLVYRCQIKIS